MTCLRSVSFFWVREVCPSPLLRIIACFLTSRTQFFTVFFTYTGYIMLITGVLWAADICAKIRHAVRKARQ